LYPYNKLFLLTTKSSEWQKSLPKNHVSNQNKFLIYTWFFYTW
jgi:hypothetical protein